MKELEKYFLLDEFEDGWGMDDEFICEEQLFDYCVEVLFIPDEKIDELNMRNDELEIVLKDLELEDICGVVIKNCEKQGLDAPYTRAISTILEFSYNKQRKKQ